MYVVQLADIQPHIVRRKVKPCSVRVAFIVAAEAHLLAIKFIQRIRSVSVFRIVDWRLRVPRT